MLQDFLRRSGRGRIAVLCHSDADGLAAGAILTRFLRHQHYQVTVDVTRKGESAWSDTVAQRLARETPSGLIVADLGSRAEPILPDVPTLIIDHHRPTGVPAGATLLTGYGQEPTPTSGLLAWQACDSPADTRWIAAISLLSDLGEKAPFAELGQARKEFGSTLLKEATALLNAPRRTSTGDGSVALEQLLEASGPAAIARSETLMAARAEVAKELEQARKTAPKFAGAVALIRIHSGCQIHPLIAQMWRARLRKNIVLAANTGYLPGKVNFAMRTATPTNLIDFLAEHRPAGAGEEYGRGHDAASGGSLSFDDWNKFARSLGFGQEAMVADGV